MFEQHIPTEGTEDEIRMLAIGQHPLSRAMQPDDREIKIRLLSSTKHGHGDRLFCAKLRSNKKIFARKPLETFKMTKLKANISTKEKVKMVCTN